MKNNLIDDYGFELIKVKAKFVNENTVEVNVNQITAKDFNSYRCFFNCCVRISDGC